MKRLLLALVISGAAQANAADVWPSFQNGGATSQVADKSLVLGDIQWTAELQGYGQSSPVVWEGQIYITTVEGDNKDSCHVTAYDLKTGARKWQHTVANATPQENSTYVSRAAPTPVADSDGVICFFEGGNIAALTHDGRVRWERNLVEDYGALSARHGLSSSLEQDQDSVFVWVERSEDPYVLSLARKDGQVQWKSAGLGATSWSSPRLVPVEGGQHLVLSAIGSVIGLDPASGKQLWKIEGITGNSTPTPMPLGGGRFLIGATVGRGESGGGRAADSNGVIGITKAEDGSWSADYVWRARRATSSFGSPIVHNDVAFFVNREGVLYGLKAVDGEEVFAKRLKGSSWATPIGVGSQVFFFGRDGKVDVLADVSDDPAISTWDGLPEPPKPETPPAGAGGGPPTFSGPVMYAAAWCGDSVLLRRGDRLFSVAVRVSE